MLFKIDCYTLLCFSFAIKCSCAFTGAYRFGRLSPWHPGRGSTIVLPAGPVKNTKDKRPAELNDRGLAMTRCGGDLQISFVQI